MSFCEEDKGLPPPGGVSHPSIHGRTFVQRPVPKSQRLCSWGFERELA